MSSSLIFVSNISYHSDSPDCSSSLTMKPEAETWLDALQLEYPLGQEPSSDKIWHHIFFHPLSEGGEGGEAHFHVHHLLLLPLPLWRPPLPPSCISGVKVKSRCVVRAKLIMAVGHRLIPIALLSAPATPVLGGTKGSTDRWDGALWDRVLSWHKKPTK